MLLRRLAFHEALGLLNVGDLHPGGAPATDFLLQRMARIEPRTVLEVGAGIGHTTQRMMDRGWKVVPIEPSDVLRDKLERRLGISSRSERFEAFEAEAASFDAVIGESAFYGMDLPSAFAKVHRLLRPGGVFAFLDTIWTDAADPKAVAAIHDETEKVFGIAVGPRVAATWPVWCASLRDTGFEEVESRRLPPGSLQADADTRRTILRSAWRHPLALAQHVHHRLKSRVSRIPGGWMETWMAVWRRR